MLSLLLPLCLFALPRVHEITPPGGGLIDAWAGNYAACVGHDNQDRPFIWTVKTGPIYLEHCAENWPGHYEGWPHPRLDIDEEAGEFIIIFNSTAPQWVWHSYILRLPKDLTVLFSPADFDYDGDVDQSDFGLWQREPQRMPLNDFLKQMGGPR